MTRPTDREAGFALLVVLAFLLLASSIATPFFTSARDYAYISRNEARLSQEEAVSDGVLLLAAQRYLERANNKTENIALPSAVRCGFGGRYPQVTISLQNDAGLIDLNAASRELLQVGFEVLGSTKEDAGKMATTVDLYRTADLQNKGREETVEVVGGLKHGLFENVAELMDFPLPPGVTSDRLDGVFTIFSRSGALAEEALSPDMKKEIKARSRSQLQFIVAGAGQLPAVTATASLRTSAGVYIRSVAHFVPDAERRGLLRNGPVTSRRTIEYAPSDKGNAAADCGEFFDEGALSLLAELMR